jgi:aryl-alcohol dehydrogenase-like predicted oxidoreductase
MKKRSLGRTNLMVSELTLGTEVLSIEDEKLDRPSTIAIRAHELGINCIETSPAYGFSEELLGDLFASKSGDIVILSTLSPHDNNFDPKNANQIRYSIEKTLESLQVDRIDVLMISNPDRPGQVDWWDDYASLYGPISDVLQDLKERGVVAATGVSGSTAYELANIAATGEYDVVLTSLNYSLLWREAGLSIIPEAKKQNMGIIIATTRQRGWFSNRYDEDILNGAGWLSPPRRKQFLELYKLLDEIDIPVAELALRWALSVPDISTLVTAPGTTKQLEDDVKFAQKGPLPEKLMKRIDEIAAMVPFRPFEEPVNCTLDLPYFDRDFRRLGSL